MSLGVYLFLYLSGMLLWIFHVMGFPLYGGTCFCVFSFQITKGFNFFHTSGLKALYWSGSFIYLLSPHDADYHSETSRGKYHYLPSTLKHDQYFLPYPQLHQGANHWCLLYFVAIFILQHTGVCVQPFSPNPLVIFDQLHWLGRLISSTSSLNHNRNNFVSSL